MPTDDTPNAVQAATDEVVCTRCLCPITAEMPGCFSRDGMIHHYLDHCIAALLARIRQQQDEIAERDQEIALLRMYVKDNDDMLRRVYHYIDNASAKEHIASLRRANAAALNEQGGV